tara:strand:+ start:363 stop:596 length:234 start_codon:yes stop_codon:yes gene_type:complete
MITVHIKYISATDNKPLRIKLTDGDNKLMVDANRYDYQQAALQFIEKYWPDCQILNFGQLPNKDSEYVALAANQGKS